MAGNRPDFDVAILTSFGAYGEAGSKLSYIGAGWTAEDGSIRFSMITNPNVRYMLCPRYDGGRRNGRSNGKSDADETA